MLLLVSESLRVVVAHVAILCAILEPWPASRNPSTVREARVLPVGWQVYGTVCARSLGGRKVRAMKIRSLLLPSLVLALYACGGDAMRAAPDVGPLPDATAAVGASDASCTAWGCIYSCVDGGCGCFTRVCISYEPIACPGPWPCSD